MKLNYRRTFVVGLAFFSICVFWQLYDHIVPLILKYTFGISDTVAGGVMAIDNVLALFMLPLFGSLSDRTITKWGRRMPFIVIGSFCACLSMMMIPIANQFVTLPLFVVGLGLTLFFMSTYRSPAVALMPDVTPKPLRSKGNAVINLMGALGNVVILGLTRVMLPSSPAEGTAEAMTYHPNYIPIFLCAMGIMIISVIVLVLRINEPKLVAEAEEVSRQYGVSDEPTAEEVAAIENKKSVPLAPPVRRSLIFLMVSIALWFAGYNAVTTHFSKYCVEVFGMGAGSSAMVLIVAQVAGIITFLPSGIIATKIGRKKCILMGILILAAAFGLGATLSSVGPLMFVAFALAGVAWAFINVNSLPMVVEMAGFGDTGKFTGYYYTASMAAQIATPILSGVFLDNIGYWTLLPYGVLFVLLSFITMLFVKHGDSKPLPPASKLEAFEAMDD